MSKLPQFEHTPMDAIRSIVDGVRNTFLSHKTRPLEWRLKQLRKLYWGLKDHEAEVYEACKLDIGKSTFETYMSELGWVMNDCIFMANNLAKWMKDEKNPDARFADMALSPRIKKEPLGVVLVIGAYNFPIQLSVGPVIGAIAAGCTVVLKPSENAPHAAALLQRIFEKSLDPSAYTVIQGAVPETTLLLEQKWNKIFYTGSDTVGKIIAKKAAETLTPVTLELGGRNPAIVTRHADLRLAARRLMWAKTHNAGQVCVSQNYILAEEEILQPLVSHIKTVLQEFYPQGVAQSPDYGRIVNLRQFQRLRSMLQNSTGKILIGGQTDESTLFFEPTIVHVTSPTDSLITSESFGPLIPILTFTSLEDAIRTANAVHDTPLGTYMFGTKSETDKILRETRSGGASVNDGFFHASMPTMPFGGVGDSGQGAYRGRASFDCFTHRRSVTHTPSWLEGMLDIRYPPYTDKKRAKFAKMSALTANFDREGNATGGWLGWVLRLGGGSAGSGIARWVLLLAVAYAARHYYVRTSKL